MPRQEEALRVNMGAQRLSHAEDNAARQCAPQIAGSADYARLECENELQRTRVRVEVRPQSQKQAGKSDRDKCNGRSHSIHKSRIHSNELDGVRIFGGSPNLASEWRVGEEQLNTTQ